MNAALKGEPIEWRLRLTNTTTDSVWVLACGPSWNWTNYDYRIRPDPAERQPLGPEDFPPGTVVRNKDGKGYIWRYVSAVYNDCIKAEGVPFTYHEAQLLLDRSLDGGKTWLPCYK